MVIIEEIFPPSEISASISSITESTNGSYQYFMDVDWDASSAGASPRPRVQKRQTDSRMEVTEYMVAIGVEPIDEPSVGRVGVRMSFEFTSVWWLNLVKN